MTFRSTDLDYPHVTTPKAVVGRSFATTMSMRALLRVAAGHDERDVEVEGDVGLASQMMLWFYVPPVE